MADVHQLELNLALALEEALDVPEAADVLALWRQFEGELSGLSQREHLRVAGDILMELSALCQTKANLLWDDWQDAYNANGPVMGDGWSQEVIRQTQEVDFSDAVQRSRKSNQKLLSDDEIEEISVAEDVMSEPVSPVVTVLEDAALKNQALAVSHTENVSNWVKMLANEQGESPQRLVDLQQKLKMPLIEVWLAALLGSFSIEQRGDFYQTQEVWVGERRGEKS